LRVDELERRLATDRTLDIFSMQPRVRFIFPHSLVFAASIERVLIS
jgi:hypothetical protein